MQVYTLVLSGDPSNFVGAYPEIVVEVVYLDLVLNKLYTWFGSILVV